MRFRRQDGASAVEFALVAPLLVILLFGIINFGVGFLQVQSIRAGLREGGRAAATGASVDEIRARTVSGSSNAIPGNQAVNVSVSPNPGQSTLPACTPNNVGTNVTVSYDTSQLPDGGVVVRIPLLPPIVMSQGPISAAFRCEV